MSEALISFLIFAGTLVAAVALNPSAEKHRTKIKEAIAERSQLEKVFGVGELTAFSTRRLVQAASVISDGAWPKDFETEVVDVTV